MLQGKAKTSGTEYMRPNILWEEWRRNFSHSCKQPLKPSSMGFDYAHYLNANLQMSECAGCNSTHLVSAIMEEVAQMCHSGGCRARQITRGSSLMWPSSPSCLRLLCPLEVFPEAEVKPIFKNDSQFLGQDQATVSAPPPFISSYRV